MTKVVETVESSQNPSMRVEEVNANKAQERKRVPMSIPRRKLEVPEKPGYVRYWFNDYPGRIQQALRGGYDFVDSRDVDITNTCLGGDVTANGNTDLGTKVSLVVGKTEEGTALRAYLMEIKEEWFKEDQTIIQDQVNMIDATIKRGSLTADGEALIVANKRYVNTYQHTTNLNRRA